jgi:hypothetical protein
LPLLMVLYLWNHGSVSSSATSHFYSQFMAYLNQHYGNRCAARDGPMPWPPRSPDLIPFNFLLWMFHERDCLQDHTIQARANSFTEMWILLLTRESNPKYCKGE